MIFIYVIAFVLIVAVGNYINSPKSKKTNYKKTENGSVKYYYERKHAVMTQAELVFYRRLEKVVDGRYYLFPQIHLSALMTSKTTGKHYKSGYQRILRRSVDYVLCDKDSMKPIYAVELDDSTHDTAKRKDRDSMVEGMLRDINLPLVRFRNVSKMTDDQIAQKFEVAAKPGEL